MYIYRSLCIQFWHRKKKSIFFTTKCLEIIHSNVWGVSLVISHAQHKYFVTFINDYSRFTWVYFLRSKANVFSVFQTFVALIETQFSACIKVLRFDSGGEYVSQFSELLTAEGDPFPMLLPLHPTAT